MNDFPRWVLRLGNWLWAPFPRNVYWVMLPLAAAMLVIYLHSASEPAIRLTGLVLQLLGIGTVIIGIEKTRELFARPTLRSVFTKWLAERPRLGRTTVTASLNAGALAMVTGKGRGYVTNNPPAGATMNERLESLEKNVGLLNSRISGVQGELDTLERQQSAALRQERDARKMADDQLREKLEGLATGGFNISLAGAAWLFVGVTLSTLAPELSRWLNQ